MSQAQRLPHTRAEFLPFSRPSLGVEEEEEVLACMRSGWITTGPRVQRFEEAFCARLGVEHAIAVNSATAGLHLAVRTLDLEPDDEVIVPSLTWAATSNVVELCGGRTVFAEVDPDTLCLDPEDVRARITEHTRAIILVHFAGQPADLDAFRALADEHGLSIIEDAAHAVGARHGEDEIGSASELVVFSFHPNKNLTTGEGGMIICRDPERARRLRLLRFHGVSKDTWMRFKKGGTPQYEVEEPGWKYNMLDLQAAIGLVQLGKLDGFNARRRELAGRYDELFADLPEIAPLVAVPWPATHAWHLYVVRLDVDALRVSRNEFMAAMAEYQIGSGLHYPALHSQAYYRERYGYTADSLPISQKAGDTVISLPLFPLLDESDQDDVVRVIAHLVETHRR
jgi:UDP-4-amino-4-deoxy-L-arabinose-oxoglutarate aminotransferase